MKKTALVLAAIAAAVVGTACGGGNKDNVIKRPHGDGPVTAGGSSVDKPALDKFNAALDALNTHDKANDWNDATCGEVAKMFEAAVAAQSSNKFPEATYDAGLVWQRCGNDGQAKSHFQQALADEPKFHYARAQLALYQFKADNNSDAAISALEQAVTDANFQNVPALVDLAMFQMQRDSQAVGANCHTKSAGKDVDLQDFDCAKLNLQRALAIDDGYMPAFNQLALYYFGSSKRGKGRAGKKFGRTIATNAAMGARGDAQQLGLAALVCSQAVRKNAKYAPIHNTSGLILNELGQVNSAVKEFQAAAQLDPNFFEAQMNLAAINLSFRGFDKAEAAYRQALKMGDHPKDMLYDAHLGLALALRGQIDETNADKQVPAVQAELDACKGLDAARPDAYFNEGILTQEYKSKLGGSTDKAVAQYTAAQTIYQSFIDKAQGKAEYDGAVKKAQDRIQDCKDLITFLQTPPDTGPPAASGSAAPAAASGSAAAPATSASAGP
jgi:tetratricopeptide (TPR) repeat protein